MTTAIIVDIDWPKRGRVRDTETACLRRYNSHCGRYAVVEITSHFGLPRRWLAVRRNPNGNERVISRHRNRARAIDACRADMRG